MTQESEQLLVPVHVASPAIAGRGLFASAPIKKRTVIAILCYMAPMMTVDDYQREQRNGNKLIEMTAIRWVGDHFLYGDEITETEFINHSFEPNMLYHLGICFALRDIVSGEELTVDYRHFLAENDVNQFDDLTTGKLVDGYGPTESLIVSTRALSELFSD